MSDQEMFDGQEIVGYVASIPAMSLEAPESYQRGTYMTLQVEVRVRSVRYEELSSGKRKGELIKVHVLATEDVKILGVLTPQERRALLEQAAAQLEEADDPSIVDAEVVEDEPRAIGGSNVEPDDRVNPDTWEYPVPEGMRDEEVAAGF